MAASVDRGLVGELPGATVEDAALDTVFSAFVSDVYSRRIVGWRTKATMPTELPLDALEMAIWTRQQTDELVHGLIHHSDRLSLVNTGLSATATGPPTLARSRRSAPSVIRSITRWPRA
jgi:transposase InsO family protein